MKLKEFIKKPKLYLIYFLGRLLPQDIKYEKNYLKLLYKEELGKKLNLDNPKRYNEKIQWLKLFDRNPIYIDLVDKYEVRKYVSKVIGEDYLIPNLGVWDKFEQIEFDKLPNSFVLKCTHDSGGLCIVDEKGKMNIKQIRKKISHCLKRNYYNNLREWPYKNVRPRIIAEKYMVDESGYELKDYKFFCFNGEVKCMFIATDRNADSETCFDFFDRNFNHLDIRNGHPNTKKSISKPENLEEMIEIAEKLGRGFPHVRIDLYNIDGKIYFGEMTFFHWSGLVPFEPDEWDYKFGEWINLPKRGE